MMQTKKEEERKERKKEEKDRELNHNCVVVVSDTCIINTYVLGMPRKRHVRGPYL